MPKTVGASLHQPIDRVVDSVWEEASELQDFELFEQGGGFVEGRRLGGGGQAALLRQPVLSQGPMLTEASPTNSAHGKSITNKHRHDLSDMRRCFSGNIGEQRNRRNAPQRRCSGGCGGGRGLLLVVD